MFRRNKKKKGNKSADTIALTSPQVESSSGVEPIATKSKGKGGFLGRRKKKANTNTNTNDSNGNKFVRSSNDANPTISDSSIKNDVSSNNKRQIETGSIAQHDIIIPETTAVSTINKRSTSSRNNDAKKKSTALSQRSTTQNIQQPKNQSSTKKSSSIPPPISDTTNRGKSKNSTGIPSTAKSVAVVPTSNQQPQAAGSIQNNNHINNNTNSVPMTRTGWSMLSNESTSMNSENYIESLDNLSVRSGKDFPTLSSQPNNMMKSTLSDDRIRTALSRKFGRNTYPSQSYHQKWNVKVTNPKWDDNEGRYKYKLNISMNSSNDIDDNMSASIGTESYSQLSFASTTTRRSLQDFVWLEQALRAEYHGALIVPILSLALYFGTTSDNLDRTGQDGRRGDESLATRSFATDTTSKGQVTVDSVLGANNINSVNNAVTQSFKYLDDKMEGNELVNETILANWLSDIINGMRGNGEVLLYNCVDVVESEAMETFLYRQSETNTNGYWPTQMGSYNQKTSSLGSPFTLFSALGGNKDNTSLLETWFENPLECFGMSSNNPCIGDKKRKPVSKRSQLASIMCSSGSTGVPGIGHCNSYLSQQDGEDQGSLDWLQANSATHSELLEAEKDVVASYLKSSALAMTKVQSLTKDEVFVGQCWKQFATSLSNLFSVEKDLEQAHIGDQIKTNKKNQPFRKLRKSSIDEALRNLGKAKVDRSNPSLGLLSSMLHSYYADLNSIVPAFKEYSEAINQLHQLDDNMNSIRKNGMGGSNLQSASNEFQSSLEQLKDMTWGKWAGNSTVVTNEFESTVDDDFSTLGSLSTAQTKALHTRVLQNEKMLKFSITLLCRSCPLRNARMAWWYLKTEAKEASNVHTAATNLRQKLSIDADAAIAMKERRYDEDEKRDDAAEIDLVKRIVDLGSSDEVINKEASRQNAIKIATEQVGRWNAKTALALMEAAGVEDAEVQIDETSRELRHVRKYAISLRENVARCLESAETLASTFIVNADNSVQISRSRREFWAAMSAVFSGKIIFDEMDSNVNPNIGMPSTRVLAGAGIDITDRGGWLGHNFSTDQSNQLRRNCGEAARQYLKKRDNQANILISRIVKLLKDYERRLEGIESFVYMHCVGIQLEKHCSKARSKALSAWEKRTDISTAINVATKKKIPKLVQELKVKLDALPQVSHTTVIKRKEEHLASKTLKSDLHKLANRRFGRAQEVSTERVIAVISLWAKHEESVAMEEVQALSEVIREVELSIQSTDVEAALDSRSLIRGRGGKKY